MARVENEAGLPQHAIAFDLTLRNNDKSEKRAARGNQEDVATKFRVVGVSPFNDDEKDYFVEGEMGAHILTENKEGRRREFILLSFLPEDAGQQAPEAWQEFLDDDPNAFSDEVGSDALLAWAIGRSAAVKGVAYPSLPAFIQAQTDLPPDFEAETHEGVRDLANLHDFDSQAGRKVFRVSVALQALLGFTPEIGFEVNA
jgi:hypothetical protein